MYGGANPSSKHGRLRQVNQEFKANLGYIKTNPKKKKFRDLTKARNAKHRK